MEKNKKDLKSISYSLIIKIYKQNIPLEEHPFDFDKIKTKNLK